MTELQSVNLSSGAFLLEHNFTNSLSALRDRFKSFLVTGISLSRFDWRLDQDHIVIESLSAVLEQTIFYPLITSQSLASLLSCVEKVCAGQIIGLG